MVQGISKQIWVEKLSSKNYQASCCLRTEILSSYFHNENCKNSIEALEALKQDIDLEIKWLQNQLEIIDLHINNNAQKTQN